MIEVTKKFKEIQEEFPNLSQEEQIMYLDGYMQGYIEGVTYARQQVKEMNNEYTRESTEVQQPQKR